MNMNWLQSILLGLVPGITEFLPISSRAHSEVFRYLYGISGKDPVLSLVMHIAMLVALFFAMRPEFDQVQREKKLRHRSKARGDSAALQALADQRVVKNAIIPMWLLMLLLRYILRWEVQLPVTSLILLFNGIVLYLPSRMMLGNKNATGMSLLDSYLLGLSGALCILSGFSGVGLILSVALFRGADRQKAWNWASFMMFPALTAEAVIDIVDLISGVGGSGSGFFQYVLVAIATFLAAYGGILLMRRLIKANQLSVFAYYSWGAALFSFLLYLSVI